MPRRPDILNDIYRVGPTKAVADLPLRPYGIVALKYPQYTLDRIRADCAARGVESRIFDGKKCAIGGGGLFAWHAPTLGRIIAENLPVIKQNNWPTTPQGFVEAVATRNILPSRNLPLYLVIARAYSDPHLVDGKLQ